MSLWARVFAGVGFAAFLAAGQNVNRTVRLDDLRVNTLDGASLAVPQLTGATTVVLFISAQCPISNAFNERMTALYNEYSSKGVKFVFINANANERDAEVAGHRKSAGFPFPVYRDPGSLVSARFGAMATPETFILDGSGVVRYHGYIEDSTNEARVRKRAVRAALNSLLAGKPVAVPETKAFGCSIKRARGTT